MIENYARFVVLLLCSLYTLPLTAQTLRRPIPQPLPGHPSNIFLRGEDVSITRPDAPGAAGWICVDYEQKTVAQSAISGDATTIKLGALPVGYYEVWATATDGKRLAKTTIGVLEPLKAPTPLDSPIGIDAATAWFYNPRDGQPARVAEAANQTALAGVNFVRDRLTWGAMEPQRGQFATSTIYDETARLHAAAGLQGLQVFHSSPKWANPDGTRIPLDLRDGYNFLKTMSVRWRGQVRAWEPWNEADIPGFGGHSGLEIATYQKAAYWGVRAGDPSALVCQNVFAQPSRTGVLENFLENEPQAYYDTFNFHHYTAPDSYPSSYGMMREAAGGKPMWVSEAGTHIPWEGDEKAQEPTWENQQRQARFVAQCFAASLAEGSRVTFFFLLPHYVEGNTQFGLTHRDLTPRPGYLSLAAAGRLLAGAQPLGKLKTDNTALRAFAFRAMPDGQARTVVVAWAQEGTARLKLPGGAQAFDVLGRPVSATNNLEVGISPIYLVYSPRVRLILTPPPAPKKRVAAKPCPVVLQPLPSPARLRLSDSSYRLERGEKYDVPFYVYNFGAQSITTRLQADTPATLKVEVPAEPITLKPMESLAVRVRISDTGSAKPAAIPVRFSADCGGQGKALAVVRFMLPIEDIEPAKSQPIPSAMLLPNWRKLQSVGDSNLSVSDEGLSVEATLQPGDRWVYPILTPPAADRPLGNWGGISFTLVPLQGQAEYRVIFDEANGSSYVIDAALPKLLEMNKPYRVVALFKSAAWGAFSKADPNGKLDLDQIQTFKIGLNTKDERVHYLVRDVRWVKYAQ